MGCTISRRSLRRPVPPEDPGHGPSYAVARSTRDNRRRWAEYLASRAIKRCREVARNGSGNTNNPARQLIVRRNLWTRRNPFVLEHDAGMQKETQNIFEGNVGKASLDRPGVLNTPKHPPPPSQDQHMLHSTHTRGREPPHETT
ncbi:hypothetical protein BD410DRAFT_791446 [Rickenella mellea]|uniref:Uncharacterized protein n=1 Tax=Rickenella mellea TaxID=50990 RepID=A0A4Y7PYI3_9AGAM|nr:hypothetical protein BD410DRAFT_791446 [Rickenella mellea]